MLETINKFTKKLTKTLGTDLFTIISVAIIPSIHYFYSIIYAHNCEEKYGVPSKYFTPESIDYIAILILCTAIGIFLYINKKIYHDTQSKIESAVVSTLSTYIFEFVLLFILTQKRSVLAYMYYFDIILIIFIFIIPIINFLSFLHLKENPINTRTKIFNIIKIFSKILSIGTVIILLFFNFLYASPMGSIYETTQINKNNYAILSEYKDQFLIVRYTNYDGWTDLEEGKYQFINKEGIEIIQKELLILPYK